MEWQGRTALIIGGVPMGSPLPEMMPDALQTVDYGSFPDIYIPPYHYPNPVTGQSWSQEKKA